MNLNEKMKHTFPFFSPMLVIRIESLTMHAIHLSFLRTKIKNRIKVKGMKKKTHDNLVIKPKLHVTCSWYEFSILHDHPTFIPSIYFRYKKI